MADNPGMRRIDSVSRRDAMVAALWSSLLSLPLAAPPAFAQTPAAPADRAVSLVTATGTIHGSERVPNAAGKVPVVLLIAGSGPTDRDGNSALLPGPNDSLKMLAEGLARNGIASVRYDKRGIAQSAAAMGTEADIRFDHYVDDAAAWVAQLQKDNRFSTLAIVGHSEGSLIGMLAARQSGANGFVSISGIARPANELLLEQLRPRLPPPLLEQCSRILDALKAGKTVVDVPTELTTLFRPGIQPYMISWFKYSPTDIMASLAMPALVIQGDADIQVPVAEASTLGIARPGTEVVIVAGMNHVLKVVGSDKVLQKNSYSDPTLPVAEQVVDAVSSFVRKLR